MFLKAGGDRPLLITVLDRIVQKNAYDLREEPRLDLRMDAALYFHRERLSRVLYSGPVVKTSFSKTKRADWLPIREKLIILQRIR